MLRSNRALAVVLAGAALGVAAPAASAQTGGCAGAPWMDTSRSPDERADRADRADDPGREGRDDARGLRQPHAREVLPIPRLCVPALRLNNGSAGVGSGGPVQPQATALPAPLGARRDRSTRHGALRTARSRGARPATIGRNLMEGPDINIARTPLNGRTFEAYGEDPYLAGPDRRREHRGHPVRRASSPTPSTTSPTTRRSTATPSTSTSTSGPCTRSTCRPSRTAVKQGDAGVGDVREEPGQRRVRLRAAGAPAGRAQGRLGLPAASSCRTSAPATTRSAARPAGWTSSCPPARTTASPLKAAVQSGQVPDGQPRRARAPDPATMFRFGLFDRPQTTTPIDARRDGADCARGRRGRHRAAEELRRRAAAAPRTARSR